MKQKQNLIFVFDPGAVTGFAVLDGETSDVLFTAPMGITELEAFVHLEPSQGVTVIVEAGPQWGNHSSITQRAETIIINKYPSAYRVPPNQWKNHPASVFKDRHITVHECDAVRLGKWFLATKERNSEGKYTT